VQRHALELQTLLAAALAHRQVGQLVERVHALVVDLRACRAQQVGVDSICHVLQIAPSAYWRHAARRRDPALCSPLTQRDARLVPVVRRVWQAKMQVYGADKVWRQLNREGVAVACCTVERLMRQEGLQGARRGKTVRTTVPDPKAPCPLDRVNRQFRAERPNQSSSTSTSIGEPPSCDALGVEAGPEHQ